MSGWFEGAMCCGFCVLWCNDGSIDLATAMAGCGSEAWMGYWGFFRRCVYECVFCSEAWIGFVF